MQSGESTLESHGPGYYIYIPSKVASDSSFPFRPGDKVVVEINGGTLNIKGTENNGGE